MSLLKRAFEDADLRHLARRAGGTYVLRIAGAAAGFAFHVAMARALGAGGAGAYYLGLSVAVLGSLGARLGLDNALLRFASTAADRGDWPALRGVLRRAVLLAGGTSVLATALVLAALSILPFSLANLQGEAFKAVGDGRTATVVQGLAVPAAALAILAAARAALGPLTTVQLAWCYTGATVLVWAGSGLRWRVVSGRQAAGTTPFPARTLLTASLPLLLVISMSAAMAPASTALLGIWLPVEAVGLYGVAQRCANLLMLVFAAVSTVSAPRFAALHARGELAALGALARRSGLLSAVIGAPFVIAFVFFGGAVLAVFGREFTAAATALTVLTLGRYLAVVTGNAVDLLMMAGQGKTLRDVVAASAVAYVVLVWLLAPRLGVDGAALARALQVVMVNLLAIVFVARRVGVNLVPGPLRGSKTS